MRPPYYLVLLAVAVGCESPPQLTQPRETSANLTTPQYTITKLSSSLGGTVNRGTAINNRGLVAGFSNLAGNLTRHAALFRDGSIVDLGTLGGTNCPECNSSVVWPGINNQGLVVGIAESADLDPLGEAWSCTAFFPSLTGHICRGFVWQAGQMTPLPTFGGNQGLGNYSLGVGADVLQKYRFDLKYIDYLGRYRDNGTAVTSQNGLTTFLRDRGAVSLTFKTTF